MARVDDRAPRRAVRGKIRRANQKASDLLDRFSYDCLWRAEARGKRRVSACGVYLPDLEQPRPPDMPPGLVRLRVVVSND